MKMRLRLVAFLLAVGLSCQLAMADWHHHHSSGGSSSHDPQMNAFVISAFLIVAAAGVVCIGAGALLVVVGAASRYAFATLPLLNLGIYAGFVLLRDYPGGLRAKFRWPGLGYTAAELLLLLILSLITALLVALLLWVVRKLKRWIRGETKESMAV